MIGNPSTSHVVNPLRRRAESQLRARSSRASSADSRRRSTADTQRLLHELQVHQIELEMQNEELRKARDAMEAGLEKYSDLYDFAPVGYLTLDREGVIRESNLAGASLLGVARGALVKRRFSGFVSPADRAGFSAFLRRVFEPAAKGECEVRLLRAGQPAVDVRMRASLSSAGPTCQVAVTDITQHKLVEAVTAQLAAIVTSSSDAIIGIDLDSVVTSWNAGAEKIFGYAASEMIGGSILRLLPSNRQHEEAQIMGRIRKGESVEHFETVRVAKGGRLLDMSVTISPVRYADGKIVGASKVGRDITGQKLVADRVRVSEIRYRRLFEAAHDGVLLLDPDTRKITDANPFMTQLLGYRREQLIGKELFEIGLLKDETASQEMFQKLKRKHEVRYEDLPLESQAGRHQEVEVVANLYDENGHAVIQCNIRDITERKRTEEALRRSEERYRSLFNSIDEGFCVIEMLFDKRARPRDYRFLTVNPSFETQSGIRGAEGKRMREIVSSIEPSWLAAYGDVARTGNPVRFTNEMKGLNRWFDVYVFRLGGAESHKLAVLFSDITARKQTDEALRAARTQLGLHAVQLERLVEERTAELMATNRRLEASVESIRRGKEEYRVLLAESEVMQQKLRRLTHQIIAAQEEERKQLSRELHDDVVQTLVGINVALAALTKRSAVRALHPEQIVRVQRLVEGSVDAVHRFARGLRPAVLDDLGLIPALHAYCRSFAERKKIKIHLTAFAGVEALGDAERTVLYRVAQEALTNVGRHAQAKVVQVNLHRKSAGVCMEIHDDGRSFQVGPALSPKTNQRLGLLGMRERLEMVGGTLTIVSAPGSGTTVRAEIPLKSQLPSS